MKTVKSSKIQVSILDLSCNKKVLFVNRIILPNMFRYFNVSKINSAITACRDVGLLPYSGTTIEHLRLNFATFFFWWKGSVHDRW